MRKFICGVTIAISLLWILGSAGALDLDQITMTGFVAQAIPAIIALYASFWIGGFGR